MYYLPSANVSTTNPERQEGVVKLDGPRVVLRHKVSHHDIFLGKVVLHPLRRSDQALSIDGFSHPG